MEMMEIQNARINTAGAYVCIQDSYVVAIGIRPHNGHIPIVRLGGHREEQETGWQCAVREVCEETGLQIKPLLTQITYLADWAHPENELQEIQWQQKVEQEAVPLLVVGHRQEESTILSLMYLAYTQGAPRPSSEVKGLLLLEKEEIHQLCGAIDTGTVSEQDTADTGLGQRHRHGPGGRTSLL